MIEFYCPKGVYNYEIRAIFEEYYTFDFDIYSVKEIRSTKNKTYGHYYSVYGRILYFVDAKRFAANERVRRRMNMKRNIVDYIQNFVTFKNSFHYH